MNVVTLVTLGHFLILKKVFVPITLAFFVFCFFFNHQDAKFPKRETLMPTSDFFGRKFSFFWDFFGEIDLEIKACFSMHIA
jgi:hypothetical protein